jgi:polyphosphate:AMP phosphotransferase
MFEMAEVGRKLSKEDHKTAEEEIRPALLEIQQQLRRDKKLSVVILVGGVEGAGKGETVNLLSYWMDPRGVEVNAFGPDEESRGRPPFYRFWMHLPPKGKIGIFFGSWYTAPIVSQALGESKKASFVHQLEQINTFEEHLSAEGVLIIKFWLHLSKEAQLKRHKKLSQDPRQCWRISKQDKEFFKLYDRFYKVSEEALRITSTGCAPWYVIEATDRRFREISVMRKLLEAVRERLEQEKVEKPHALPMEIPQQPPKTVLDTMDLSLSIPEKDYEKEIRELQGEINELGHEAFQRGVSTVTAFEGWDAAGKGGTIRRLTQGLDARNYRVVSISAPTEEEQAQPYLWRFWRHLPIAGHMTIFDRTWYGRVLVERIEGFCHTADWRRAYSEINDFEAQLVQNGTVVTKYWLHLSPQEQLRRFEERRDTPYKQFKITDDDWRNRDKWNAYLVALDEMFARTSTAVAPWTIVPANDKLYERITVLAVFRDNLKRALKKSGKKRQFVALH